MSLRLSNLLVACCFAAFAQVLHADSIVLRSSLRTTGESPILLRDIANLEGSDAIALGSVVVVEHPASRNSPQVIEVSADEVRTAIHAARPRTRWGRIALNGDTCTVRLVAPKEEREPKAIAPVPMPAEKFKPVGPSWTIASDFNEENVRSAIAARLVSFLKVDPASVRLVFAEADSSLLEQAGVGRTLDIQPTGLGAQVPVLVRVFEGERVIAAGTVKVRVEQKRPVVVASRSLHRGDTVSSEVVLCEERWVAPGERYSVENSVMGCVVKNRLEPGQIFIEGDVEAALLVKRGEIVNIACLTGSIVMNTRARALAAGREGETIDFAPIRDPKSRIAAKVVSAGQAVIQAEEPEDHIFQNRPVAAATPDHPRPSSLSAAPLPTVAKKAEVGTISVEKVTNNPDGTFVVQARTQDPRRPIKKMKFLPIDVP